MKNLHDDANAKWYKQIPTPFETQAPEHTMKITRSEAGQVVEINIYAGFVSKNSRYEEIDDAPIDARKYRLIRSFERSDQSKHPVRAIPVIKLTVDFQAVEAPFLLIAEMDPSEDEDDFNEWYNQEHVPMVAEMLGYVRCGRYEIVTEGSALKPARKYFTIHEVQDLNGFTGPEARASGVTKWTQKHMSQVKGFKMTGWKLDRV